MMGTPEKVIKVPFKANYFLNSTMMASFLPVIVSKKNKQTENYVFYCSVSQIHINPEEKHEKTHHRSNDCLNLPDQGV